MISETTIRGFLQRELDNFDWAKGLSIDQVDEALAQLIPYELTKGLWLHQKVSLLILQHQPRFALHLPPGAGKTNLILTLLRHRKLTSNPKAIVFVPSITSTETWLLETAKFAPELKCCALIGSSVENIETLKSTDFDLYVMCYQSAVAMVSLPTLIKGKSKWVLEPKLVTECFGSFDTVVMDESQKTKGSNTLTFKLCKVLSKNAEYVYGLTGTPSGRNLEDLWAQFYLIDFGDTLGPTIGFYRAVFFNIKRKFWGGFEFKFKKRLMPQLQRMIKNKSIRYSVDEFSDMPEKQYIKRYLTLPEGIKGYVKKAKDELKDAVTGRQHELAGNSYIQLRQLSSGFLTLRDAVETIKVKFDSNPKLDALCELIEGMPPECKAVVFHEFVFTNELISNRLKELKIDHARVWGGQRDQLGQLKKFREAPDCRVLIINSRSGSASLNLQFANYLVFFEQPTSAIDRQQAEARVWRSGQQRRVMIYDLFVNGTYDRRQFDANLEGKNLLQTLLDGKEEV
jgi:SNF2 family DNA or RNA helicase